MGVLANGGRVRAFRALLATVLLVSMVAMPAVASARVVAQPILDGEINGTVTDPDGFGVRQAAVYVYAPDGAGGWVMQYPDSGWGSGEWAQTLEDGSFSFQIAPGTYRLKFEDYYGDYELRDWFFVREYYNDRSTIFAASDVTVTSGLTVTCDAVVAIEEYGTGAGIITDSMTGVGTYDVGVDFYRHDGVFGLEWVQGGGSNSLGDWMTETIPSGAYKVQFKDDYGRYASQWNGDTSLSLSPTVTIAPNYVTSGINAAMKHTSSISGKITAAYTSPPVVDAPGVMPLAYVWDADEGAWMEANDTGLQRSTDSSGNYTITGLDPGDYKIRFVPDNGEYAYCKFWADQVYGASGAAAFSPDYPGNDWEVTYGPQLSEGTTITVSANENLTGLNQFIPWGTFIEGKVTYAAGGANVENHRATVYDPTGVIVVGETLTGADGRWTMRNLDNGFGYKVRFDDMSDQSGYSADPGFFYYTEWWKDGGNVGSATFADPISGNMGYADAQIDATSFWGNVQGTVRDMHAASGTKKLEGMWVVLNVYDAGLDTWIPQEVCPTDASGAYSFDRVPTGWVRLRAYQDEFESGIDVGQVYDESWFNGVDVANPGTGIGCYVTPAATATADIWMPLKSAAEWDPSITMGGIYGKVGAVGGTAGVAGVPVSFYRHDTESGEWWYNGQKTTNSEGDYCTGLPSGDYKVSFGPTVALADEFYSNAATLGPAATVSVGATPTAVYTSRDASLGPAYTISGTVRNGSGAPLEGAEVRAYVYDDVWDVWAPVSYEEADAEVGAAVALTNASGAYTVGGLKSGVPYKIGFSKWVEGDVYPPDWNRTYWASGGSAASIDQAQEIVLSGVSTASVNGTLTAGSYVRGSLVDQDGKRVGQVHVKLWQKGPGEQWNQINSTYSSGQGDFQFEGFGAGDYRMEFVDDTNFLYGYRWYKSADTSSSSDAIVFTGGDTKVVTATLEAVDTAYSPIFGANRYETAVRAAEEAFPMGASTVVISTGKNWPDALGGSALAGAYDGPMLLVGDALPTVVGDCIDDLGANRAIIIGGTGAVSTLVATQIASHVGGMSHVSRIAGANRYATANLVAEATIDRLGPAYDGTAFMATGGNFPDALGASPLAAAASWPIFLANPVTGLEAATRQSMTDHGVSHVLILGGEGAVAPSVEAALNAAFGDPNVERLAGANRYSTAAIIAQYGVDHVFGLGWNNVAFSTGVNFPDALAGGVLQGMTGSVMLLTGATTVDPSVAAVLTANKSTIAEVRFLGGTGAVTEAVRTLIYQLLN